MKLIAQNVPLWSVTTWDKKFTGVDRAWQPRTIKYKYLLSSELDRINVGGNVRLLYTGMDSGTTTEELAGDAICEGEIVSIPWGGTPTVKYYKGRFVTGDNRIATSSIPQQLLNKYLFYFMKGRIEEIGSYYRGAGLKHPSMKSVLGMSISYPSIKEQQRIICQFEAIERLIDSGQMELKKLDELIKSRFIEMFGDPVHGKEWQRVSLETACSKLGSGATPRGGKSSYLEEGIPLIRSMNVHNGHFIWKDLAYIGERQAEKLKGVVLQQGDVLLNITGASVARSCVLPSELVGGRVNQHVAIVRPKQKQVLPVVLNSIFTSRSYQDYLLSGSKMAGATREAITKQDLKKMTIPLLPLALQRQFADFVVQVDKLKFETQQSIDKLQMLYDSLAQEYFGS